MAEESECGVSNMVSYLLISGIMMMFIIITILAFTQFGIYRPTDQLTQYAFIDIGNGISTRIVDLYVIVPLERGNITTKFDIPDDVVGREYNVLIDTDTSGDYIRVSHSNIQRTVPLSGIGETLGVSGSTTGHGLNVILFDSAGWEI